MIRSESKLVSREVCCYRSIAYLFQVSSVFLEYLRNEIDSFFISKVGIEQTASVVNNGSIDTGIIAGRRLGQKLTGQSSPFAEPKDAVKFICKEVWNSVFNQQASRLQANKKGQYVIHDVNFPPLQNLSKCCLKDGSPTFTNIPPSVLGPLSHPSLVPNTQSMDDGSPGSVMSRRSHPPNDRITDDVYRRALWQLNFTSGMIRGFLEIVGFSSVVEGCITGCLPACAFNIVFRQSSSAVLNPSRLLGNAGGTTEASI